MTLCKGLTCFRYPFVSGRGFSGCCGRTGPCAPAPGRFLAPGGFRREPPVPHSRGGPSRRVGNMLVFVSRVFGRVCFISRLPESDSLFQSRSNLTALCGIFTVASPAIGEVLSPFGPSKGPASKGDSLRRIWSTQTRGLQPPAFHFLTRFLGPGPSFFGGSRLANRPAYSSLASGKVRSPLRPCGRHAWATRFAGYGT